MNLQLIFRINGAILFMNGLFFLFLTEMFLGMAGFDMTAQLQTLGQAMGVSLIAVAILSWRTPDIAGSAIASYGQLFAIIGLLWVLLLGFHGATGSYLSSFICTLLLCCSCRVLFFNYKLKNKFLIK